MGVTEYSERFTIDDMADDDVTLIDHLGIGRGHILGWSMRSHIGQSLGIRHPDRIITFTLMFTYMRCPSRSEYILISPTDTTLRRKAPISCLVMVVNVFCFQESVFTDYEAREKVMLIPQRMRELEGLMDQLAMVNSYDTTYMALMISVSMVVYDGMDIIVKLDEQKGGRDRPGEQAPALGVRGPQYSHQRLCRQSQGIHVWKKKIRPGCPERVGRE